jgi:hypothetical protein
VSPLLSLNTESAEVATSASFIRGAGKIRNKYRGTTKIETENSARDLESPLEPYIAYVCEGSDQEIKMQPGTIRKH